MDVKLSKKEIKTIIETLKEHVIYLTLKDGIPTREKTNKKIQKLNILRWKIEKNYFLY